MGNKPSLEKAFDTANQQPQYNQPYPGNHSQPYPQQPAHGGGQQQHHQQSHNQQYNNQGAPHAPSPHLDEGDDPEYSRLRGLAHQAAMTRNECYERSQQAYKSGDGAQAKELSNQGHEHDRLMKQYNKQAADFVFEKKNRGRSPDEVDLHGLFVQEATERAEEAIARCQREGRDHLTIIVGRGNHSIDHIAKLKPAITTMVEKYNVHVEPNTPNPGCLYVEFGKGKGDMRWLDRLEDKVRSGDCVVM
ncbi:hypothetical protein K450DRAFT_239878 [Umbelopsis ramanniana AG]|uniref:Smr domain-containing protein n=1 Tax=Umbelopsis ramanniana AG TaxID=1314678 RepID=A0AAD5EAR0_UMBRA|nr:uncharacterized protein K450DRAFT_239878 [Umbelopsis ramanniana AG]KAI8579952.1 hypothetical protein K450DRAFT_239878 [Umbelopsis ramanniana AG]